jgi:IS30 family transposase
MASRLSVEEREDLALGLARGESLRTIAGRLGRSHSTLSREVANNSFHAHAVRFGRPEMVYRATVADRVAAAKRARRGRPRLAQPGPLRTAVLRLLDKRWSPEQIAGWLARAYPHQPEMQVSHETIYQAIYLQARGGLRAELADQVALRSGRASRRTRPVEGGATRSRRPWLGLRLAERPPDAEDRRVPGHWEGDLVVGVNRASAIATIVERATRYVILVALPEGRVSEHVISQLVAAMAGLPAQLRASLTWDQGAEMARHWALTMATDLTVYFCDPHSPWQRGSNENTNGLLRQYFPKGKTDFRHVTQQQLDTVAHELNTRPRKTLDWHTPAEKLAELLNRSGAASH